MVMNPFQEMEGEISSSTPPSDIAKLLSSLNS